MRRSAKQKFLDLAAAHGVGVEYLEGRRSHPRTGEVVPWEITLDAPPGRRFAGSGTSVDCSLRGDGIDYGPGNALNRAPQVTPDWRLLLTRLEQILDDGFEDEDED